MAAAPLGVRRTTVLSISVVMPGCNLVGCDRLAVVVDQRRPRRRSARGPRPAAGPRPRGEGIGAGAACAHAAPPRPAAPATVRSQTPDALGQPRSDRAVSEPRGTKSKPVSRSGLSIARESSLPGASLERRTGRFCGRLVVGLAGRGRRRGFVVAVRARRQRRNGSGACLASSSRRDLELNHLGEQAPSARAPFAAAKPWSGRTRRRRTPPGRSAGRARPPRRPARFRPPPGGGRRRCRRGTRTGAMRRPRGVASAASLTGRSPVEHAQAQPQQFVEQAARMRRVTAWASVSKLGAGPGASTRGRPADPGTRHR